MDSDYLAFVTEWMAEHPDLVEVELRIIEKRNRLAKERAKYPDQELRNRMKAKKWQDAHPDVVKSAQENRRARVAGNGGSFTARGWKELRRKYGNRCLCCGHNDVKLVADHVIPVSKGGSNDISNIQPLCKQCNDTKHVDSTDFRPGADEWASNE
jgi:5-methylcytosine-specific restriction endonuclease McrA